MKEHLDRKWLQREWIEKHRLLKDIAAECGVSKEAVRQQAAKFGLKYLSPTERIDALWLREQVECKRRTQKDIGHEIGLSKDAVGILCRRHGIKRTQMSPAERLNRRTENAARYFAKRYSTDPDYRAGCIERAKRWQREHPDKARDAVRRWRERHSTLLGSATPM